LCHLVIPDSQNLAFTLNCGANIINGGHHVLTAAHCFEEFNPFNTSITGIFCEAGVTLLNDNTSSTLQVSSGFALHIHPQFNKTNLQHDIALLRVYPPFRLGNSVSTIPLATKLPSSGTSVTVAGWGVTTPSGDISNQLLYTSFPILAESTCQKFYAAKINTSLQVCAGDVSGKDDCFGDSGGGIFTTSNVNAPVDAQLVGLVSYGPPQCGVNGTAVPTVYTDIPDFGIHWVNHVLSSVSCRTECTQAFRYCKSLFDSNRGCRAQKNRCFNFCQPLKSSS